MKVYFAILSFILFLGMLGEKENKHRRNCTYGFIATVAAIVALYIIG